MPHTQSHQSDHAQRQDLEFLRIPGLFRAWELQFVLSAGADYRIEEHGRDTCGTRLFAIYKRESPEEEVSA